MNFTRRELIRELMLAGLSATAAGAVLAGCAKTAPSGPDASTAAGPGAPSPVGKPVRLGFIPLTDCASLVVAKELGFFKKHGVEVDIQKQANWLAVRDKLSSGELDGSHCLFGMPFSVATGVSKAKGDPMKIAMIINNNGQATTLSNKAFAGVKYGDFAGLKKSVDALRATKQPSFAMTFPGGTHDMWMHLTLAAAGIDPKSVQVKVIPPPQMVQNMQAGNMDGFNVGEPWNGRAVKENLGFTFIATQDLWKDHPEKALVVNGRFAETRRDDLKKVMMAMLEASQFIDEQKNKAQVAEVIGTKAYVGAEPSVIAGRLAGEYDLGGGLGKKSFAASKDYMLFHNDGQTNFPRYGYGVWFLTQYARFGKLPALPADPLKIAKDIILQDLYREVATEMKIAIPEDDMKPFTVQADNVAFDPTKPADALKIYTARQNVLKARMA